MENSIYVDKKLSNMTVPDKIPPLDQEQIDAGRWLAEDGRETGLLFSDPGAGKTLTAIFGMAELAFGARLAKGKLDKVLVVCPTIALREWAIWITAYYRAACLSSRVQIITKNATVIDPDATHVVVSYGVAGRGGSAVAEAARGMAWSVLACDESHNMANLKTARAREIIGPGSIAKVAKRVWFITGTPIPRYQDGLWPMLRRFPDRMRSIGVNNYQDFVNMFCYTRRVRYGGMRQAREVISGNRNKDIMTALLYGEPAIAWRNKLVIRDKPVFHDMTLPLRPSKELRRLQEAALAGEQEFDSYGNIVKVVDPVMVEALHLYGVELAPNVAGAVTGLLQDRDDGILVLYWHKKVGDVLRERLADYGVLTVQIDGSTSTRERERLVDAFNNGECDVLLGQIQAVGVALNLQKNCHTVVFAEDTYSDTMNMQAYQRVWRRGQTKTVEIYRAKTVLPLSDIRINVAARKGSDAADILG